MTASRQRARSTQRDPGQHVVIYTGSDQYGDVARADEAGAAGYLHKDALTSPDLADALHVLHTNYRQARPTPTVDQDAAQLVDGGETREDLLDPVLPERAHAASDRRGFDLLSGAVPGDQVPEIASVIVMNWKIAIRPR